MKPKEQKPNMSFGGRVREPSFLGVGSPFREKPTASKWVLRSGSRIHAMMVLRCSHPLEPRVEP